MTINAKPLDQSTEAELAALMGVAERRDLEFKRDAIGNSSANRKEFLKDVSALANAIGGDLVLGIDEVGGAASVIVPLQLSDPGAEEVRLQQILDSGIFPRLVGTHIRAVPVTGGHVIVVRVRPGWQPPHRVTFENSNRYFQRVGAQSVEMDHNQLREAFLGGTELARRLATLRVSRLKVIYSQSPHRLLEPGAAVLHIVPVQPGSAVLDPEAAHKIQGSFVPINSSGFGAQYNFEGFVLTNTSGEQHVRAYTQIFRNGTIESACGKIMFDRPERGLSRLLGWSGFLPSIMDHLPRMIGGLRELGFSAPFAVMLSFIKMQGSLLLHQGDMFLEERAKNQTDELLFEPVMIEDTTFPNQWQTAFRRPFFDRLWQAHGYARCFGPFDESGAWTGRFG